MPEEVQRYVCKICRQDYPSLVGAEQCEAKGIKGDDFSIGDELYPLDWGGASFDKNKTVRVAGKRVVNALHKAKYELAQRGSKPIKIEGEDLERKYIRGTDPRLELDWENKGWAQLFPLQRYIRVVRQPDPSDALMLQMCEWPWFKDAYQELFILRPSEEELGWFQIYSPPAEDTLDI